MLDITLAELNDHYDRIQQRNAAQELIASLRAAAEPKASQITGMPRSQGVHDKVGDLAIEIADLQASIDALDAEIRSSETEIAEFIAEIPDSRTRTVFRLRFIRGFSWKVVAEIIGNYTTPSAVKSICYAYFR